MNEVMRTILAKECPECGEIVDDWADECPACGYSMDGEGWRGILWGLLLAAPFWLCLCVVAGNW